MGHVGMQSTHRRRDLYSAFLIMPSLRGIPCHVEAPHANATRRYLQVCMAAGFGPLPWPSWRQIWLRANMPAMQA